MAADLAPGGTNDNADEYTLETARGRDDGIFLIWPAGCTTTTRPDKIIYLGNFEKLPRYHFW